MAQKCINSVLLEAPIEYFLCVNKAELTALTKQKKTPSTIEFNTSVKGVAWHVTHDDTGIEYIIVYINPDKVHHDTDAELTLTHEAVHVWQYFRKVLVTHAIEPSSDALWEVEAYSISTIAYNLIHEYYKRRHFTEDSK